MTANFVRTIALLLALVVAAPATLHSQDAATAPTAAATFLQPGAVDGKALIGPPPRPGSAADGQDLATVLWEQRVRTPADIAFVRSDLDLERFAPILGEDLLTVNGPALSAMFETAIADVYTIVDPLKASYGRKRPFVGHPDLVEPATEARPVASYPSGHATRAVVYARILAEIFPGKRDALVALGEEVGFGRVTAGVHYPTDVIAGQKLGHALADAILAGPAFEAAMERVRPGQ